MTQKTHIKGIDCSKKKRGDERLSMYVRGDFYVCPNPLSLDTYTVCEYDCVYCFVKTMESTVAKRRAEKGLRPIDPKGLEKKIEKYLKYKIPVIIGRKCEALCKSEIIYKNTLKVLEILADYEFPTVIETKGLFLDSHKKVLKVINYLSKAGILVSVTPGSDELSRKLEPGLPVYSERFKTAKELKEIGLWVGIKAEPIIPKINTDPEDLIRFADRCVEAGVNAVNFGDMRIFNPKIDYERWKKAGYDLLEIVKAKRKYWIGIANFLLEELKKRGLKTACPDWVNFGLATDCESCCGFDGAFNFHKFTFQHALRIIQQKGKVTIRDMARYNIFGEKALEKFKKVWNNESRRYFTLSDVKGIEVIGLDQEGNKIYGKRKTLKEALGWKS